MEPNSPSNTDIPCASEKQAHKFILDALREGDPLDQESEEASPVPESVSLSPETPIADSNIVSEPKPLPPGKKYFRTGETSELLGVESHVLRYWESEFSDIRPMRSKSGHRVYSRKDLELFQMVHQLLYVDKYSIKGAKKQLREKKKHSHERNEMELAHKKRLKALARDIKELISLARSSSG